MSEFADWLPTFRFFRDTSEIAAFADAPSTRAFVITKNAPADLAAIQAATQENFETLLDSDTLVILRRRR